MNEIYIFDIDGTLTQPRQRMDRAFADAFFAFCQRWPVYLASGSDYPKIAEQVPEDIIERVAGIFPCAGAEFWQGPLCRNADDHQFPQGLVALFQSLMITSPYPHRFGAHVEKRTGMLNVSVVGRSADHKQRKAYRAWDDRQGERAAIARILAEAFPAYEYAVGETSVSTSSRKAPTRLASCAAWTGFIRTQPIGSLATERPRAAMTGRWRKRCGRADQSIRFSA